MGNDEASGSPWISSLPENSASAHALAGGAEERVVLLGGEAGERLEDVRVVGGALLERPLLHGERDGVGQRRVERLALLEHLLEAPVGVLGQALALHRQREDVLAERVVRRLR